MAIATPSLFYYRERSPVPNVQKAGWASGPIWTGRESLAPEGVQTPTLQPVRRRYTDYAIATAYFKILQIIKFAMFGGRIVLRKLGNLEFWFYGG